MSSRAASRLAHLGFGDLYIYKPAKIEWLAYWLPWEGTAKIRMVGSMARRNPPACRLGERCGDTVRRLPPREDTCIVVDEHNVVQGVLTRERMVANSGASVETAMERGPLTVRPSERLDRFAQRLERANVPSAAVTTPDGRLWGLLSRSEAESSLRNSQGDQDARRDREGIPFARGKTGARGLSTKPDSSKATRAASCQQEGC